MLQPLDLEKSNELFTKRIFTFDNNYCSNIAPPNLETIGREIVGRCGGIPLAIVLIAGMLRARERTEHAWNRVLETMSQNIQDQCAKILALSYNDLPTALRPCFLYFGLFPEDHEITAFDLTNMWVAENFIIVSNGTGREVEDTAEDYLNDLVSRNLIQVSRRTFHGRIASCRIHDLLHSLCITLGRESNFFLTKGNASADPSVVTRSRRLAFYSGGVNEFFSSFAKPEKLRALLYFSEDSYTSVKSKLNFKLLRVLSMHIPMSYSERTDTSIPQGIGNLSSLSYLKLQGENFVGTIPRSVAKLKHLMTLDVQRTSVHIYFDVMEMKQLRHLRPSNSAHPRPPVFLFNVLLPNLQTLLWIKDYFFKAKWLHKLTNLRKLGLRVHSKFMIEAFSTPVAILPKLEVLKLHKYHWIGIRTRSNLHGQQINLSSYDNLLKLSLLHVDLNIVNFEAFPPNLVKLSLIHVILDTYHITMLECLPKLKILKMEAMFKYDPNKMDLSGADSFPQLEVLHILGWQSWEVTVDELAMPKLNMVILSNVYAGSIRLSERLERLRIYR